jgi:hypothetical protein
LKSPWALDVLQTHKARSSGVGHSKVSSAAAQAAPVGGHLEACGFGFPLELEVCRTMGFLFLGRAGTCLASPCAPGSPSPAGPSLWTPLRFLETLLCRKALPRNLVPTWPHAVLFWKEDGRCMGGGFSFKQQKLYLANLNKKGN